MHIGSVLGGAVVVETVFSWPDSGASPSRRCSAATTACCSACCCCRRCSSSSPTSWSTCCTRGSIRASRCADDRGARHSAPRVRRCGKNRALRSFLRNPAGIIALLFWLGRDRCSRSPAPYLYPDDPLTMVARAVPLAGTEIRPIRSAPTRSGATSLAGVVYGTRISLLVGFAAMLLGDHHRADRRRGRPANSAGGPTTCWSSSSRSSRRCRTSYCW